MLEDARSLWQDLSGLAHDRLYLAALETKLAGESLVTMIAAAVMAAVVLVSAWLGLVAAGVLVLVGRGVTASTAMLVGVGANLLIALFLYAVIRRKSRYLLWAASMRSFRSASAQHDPEGRDASR